MNTRENAHNCENSCCSSRLHCTNDSFEHQNPVRNPINLNKLSIDPYFGGDQIARIFEYFVVCGLGPEIRTLDGDKGYHGTGILFLPSLLDQYPPSDHSLYPPPPPQLPTCVLPAGVEFYSSGFNSNDPSTFPRSYPIVLPEGDGSKIYVSCIAFRDPVCEDIAESYRLPANSYAGKCICFVSWGPAFRLCVKH